MNEFEFEGSWNEIKGLLRQKYGQLTDSDVDFVEGKGDELLGRLQSKLGMSADQLQTVLKEMQAQTWNGAGRFRDLSGFLSVLPFSRRADGVSRPSLVSADLFDSVAHAHRVGGGDFAADCGDADAGVARRVRGA